MLETLNGRRSRTASPVQLAAAMLGLAVLGAVIATIRLDAKSFIYDETVTGGYAFLSMARLWRVITGPDPNMGLYYVLIHFWARVFGYGTGALRSLSVVFGALSIPLAAAVGGRLFGRGAGLTAALLMAVNACLLFYEQQARAYSLLVLLTLASTLLFLRALDEPSAPRLAAYAVAAIVSVYAHYFAALVLLIHLLGWMMSDVPAARQLRRGWLAVAAVIVAGCIPEAIVAPHDSSNIDWLGEPSLHALVTFPTFLNGGPVPYGHAPELATAILAVLALFWFATELDGEDAWQTRFTAAWLVLPVILVFAESRLGKSFWNPRYLIIVLPPLLFLAAAGLFKLRGRVAIGVVLAALLTLSAIDLHKVYVTPAIDNYRASAPYLLDHARPGDRAIYDERNTESTTHGVDSGVWYYGLLLGRTPPRPVTLRALRDGAAGHPARIWLVWRSSDPDPARTLAGLRRQLARSYTQSGPALYFGQGPLLALFVRRSGAA